MSNPLLTIAVTQRLDTDQHGQQRDVLEHSYLKFLEHWPIRVIPVSNAFEEVAHQLEQLKPEGIILTGGNDVLYGSAAAEVDQKNTNQRNLVESNILHWAVETHTPVLGICRGMQFINHYFGGEIEQEIACHSKTKQHPPAVSHETAITDAILAELLEYQKVRTNSYHNQGVTVQGLATVAKAFALATDSNIVEGLYIEGMPIAGVQWHPERTKDSHVLDGLLINSFINRTLYWT